MINRLIFVVILINFLTTICESEEDSFLLPPSFTLGESPEVSEYNLLDAFTIPLQDPKTQYVGESEDGFPAYGFRIGADVKISYKQILPDILSEEFAILINVKPGSKNGGFIFAIVNAMETIVELGVRIAPENGSTTTLFLYYTDITVEVPSSNILANFTVPKFSYKWTKFAFKVTQDDVTLFFNCTEFETIETHRNPLKLTFESASTLYLAKAGPLIGDAFEGALTHVKIYKDPGMAAEQCKTDFQDFISLQDEETENTIENNEIIEDNFEIISNDINSKVERTDYPPFRREDVDSLGTFPPPPPLPDGAGKYKGEKGERGPKGTPGESIRGPPGPPGTPGTPGSPGKPAPEATCSCNVTSILSALNGKLPYSPAVSLVPGKEGVPGTPGRPGEKGAIGARGEKGERGERGPPGQRGEQGKDGVPGLPGPPGPSGPPGPTEIDGVNVSDLKKGSSGVPIVRAGIPGSKGEPGQTGNAGTKGDKGSQGSKGALGPKGDRGDRGLPGEKGTQGIKGEAGIDGFPGTPGSKGEIGPPGNPGILTTNGTTAVIDCPPGPRGVDGMPGLKGETGAPGQRGLIGPPGITGEKGQVGLDGGIGPVGSPGSKGEKGDRGPPGEVFLQKGIHGDGEILMLKGEKGELGRRGRRGKPGPQGPIGRIGPPGLPGLKGEKGDSSSASGGSNEKGEKGAPGIPGRDAESRTIPIPGPPGPPGPPGLPGLSITGPKGEPGESIFSEPLFNLRPGRSTDSPPIAHAVIQQHQNKKIEPVSSGAMAFKTRNMMLEATKESPIGTMVYIIEEESLLVRVNAGWQYVALGALLHTDTHPTTTSPPHQVHPPFESSNLINQNMLHKIPSIKPKLPPSPSLHSSFDSSISKQELPSRSSSDDVKTTQFATLRIAALNNPYNGKSGGVSGADYDCYREAHRAGLKGTFRAFLSSRAQDVKSIVRDVDRILPVSNLRGEILFDSWSDIFDGRGGTFRHQPRIFSFNGKNVMTDPHWPIKSAWHGALPDGTRALDISCEAWQNFQYDKLGLAGNLKGQMLIDQNPTSCDKKLIVLCIEATSEIYQQRRRRRGTIEYHNNNNDGNEETLLTQEQYSQLLNSIH